MQMGNKPGENAPFVVPGVLPRRGNSPTRPRQGYETDFRPGEPGSRNHGRHPAEGGQVAVAGALGADIPGQGTLHEVAADLGAATGGDLASHGLDTLPPATAVDSVKGPAVAMEPPDGTTLEPGFVDTSSGQRSVGRYRVNGVPTMKFVAPPPPTGPTQHP